MPCRLRRGSDPFLAALPWSAIPQLVVDEGAAQDGDTVGLSRAVAGVAETGTLALASGADNPVTLGFVPDTHIVVLRADTIVGSYEAASALVRAAADGAMPRTLNLVTGASRTGDIGGKIVMGAHGPRRLAVILLPARREYYFLRAALHAAGKRDLAARRTFARHAALIVAVLAAGAALASATAVASRPRWPRAGRWIATALKVPNSNLRASTFVLPPLAAYASAR